MRLRAGADGRLAPIEGPRRSLPDSLTVVSDFRTKVWLFSIGLTGLVTDVVLTRTPHALGWQTTFRQEPHWHLPLAVSQLVKGSLRRPFADSGARYRVTVADGSDTRTRLERDGDVTVQESAIMRWFGGIGAHALREFAGPSEEQRNAYLATLFAALRMDIDADLSAAATVAGDVTPSKSRP
jgi:hypothetical protein